MTNTVFDIRFKYFDFLCRGMNKINDPKKQHECISIKKLLQFLRMIFPNWRYHWNVNDY